MSIRRIVVAISLFVLLAIAGCNLRPHFSEAPGTINYQRGRAVLHDPFPDNSIGPPVDGGRPSGFERPLAEPVKIQSTSPARRPGT
jgi:hypothetical protein